MTTKLTAAVIGGGMGGKLSMTALQNSDRFELVAAADLQPAVCEALSAQFSLGDRRIGAADLAFGLFALLVLSFPDKYCAFRHLSISACAVELSGRW